MTNFWLSMEIRSDAVTYELPDNTQIIIFRMIFDDFSNFTIRDMRSTHFDCFVQAFLGNSDQMSAEFIHISN